MWGFQVPLLQAGAGGDSIQQPWVWWASSDASHRRLATGEVLEVPFKDTHLMKPDNKPDAKKPGFPTKKKHEGKESKETKPPFKKPTK